MGNQATEASFVIGTERLMLRPYAVDDIDVVAAIFGDAKTMAFYPEPFSREKVTQLVNRNRATWDNSGFGSLVVIECETGRVVGDCGITIQTIDSVEEYEVGYRFCASVWGKGFAPEAARAVIDYGFNHLAIPRLYSYMPSDHRQSRRVAEKVGMTWVKEYRNPGNRNRLTSVYRISTPSIDG